MSDTKKQRIKLRKYEERDFNLLKRLLGDPKMMKHLGGPESKEKLKERHQRYLTSEGCYTIEEIKTKKSVGWIGNWEITKNNEKVWETGWNILPEYQQKGIATEATRLILEKMRKEQKYQYVHAYPSVDNKASNALCKKAGFTLLEEVELEYPKGHWMRCNDWKKDLKKE